MEYNNLEGQACPVCNKAFMENTGDYRLIGVDTKRDWPITVFACMNCGNLQLRTSKSAFDKVLGNRD